MNEERVVHKRDDEGGIVLDVYNNLLVFVYLHFYSKHYPFEAQVATQMVQCSDHYLQVARLFQ